MTKDSDDGAPFFQFIKHPRVYQAFKYFVYFALACTTSNFFFENLSTMNTVYTEEVKFKDIIVIFTDAIDTFAWLVLLIVLELKTYVIPDEKLKGALGSFLLILSIICWVAITYAFYGYIATMSVPRGFEASTLNSACDLVQSGQYTFAISLGDYVPLDAINCLQLGADAQFNEDLSLFVTGEKVRELKQLGWIDVVNAGTWLLVVIVLELEVFLQSSKLVGTKFYMGYKWSKLVLYGILLVCAILWALHGLPWEAGDAFMWLLAFFFIEMNVFSWQEEVAEERHLRESLEPPKS